VEDEPTLPAGQRLAVEGAMDGFKIVNTRTVTRAGEEPRILRLGSNYRSSRNVVLVGTGGRPAGPSQVTPNRPTSGSSAETNRSAAPASGAPASKPTNNQQPAPAAKPSNGTSSQPAAKPSNQPAPAAKPIISPLFPTSPGSATRTAP